MQIYASLAINNPLYHHAQYIVDLLAAAGWGWAPISGEQLLSLHLKGKPQMSDFSTITSSNLWCIIKCPAGVTHACWGVVVMMMQALHYMNRSVQRPEDKRQGGTTLGLPSFLIKKSCTYCLSCMVLMLRWEDATRRGVMRSKVQQEEGFWVSHGMFSLLVTLLVMNIYLFSFSGLVKK